MKIKKSIQFFLAKAIQAQVRNITFNHLLSLGSNKAEHQNDAVRTTFRWPEFIKGSAWGCGRLHHRDFPMGLGDNFLRSHVRRGCTSLEKAIARLPGFTARLCHACDQGAARSWVSHLTSTKRHKP